MDALRILRRHTFTNFTIPPLVRLGLDALRLDLAAVKRQLVLARTGTVVAASVVILTEEAEALIADVAADGVIG